MIGFIGAGKMAEAIMAGMLRDAVCQPQDIGIFDIASSRVADLHVQFGVVAYDSNAALVTGCDTIILAVKPQNLDAVMEEISAQVADRCVISIAAGRMIAGLERGLPQARIIRVMPNLACQVGAGMSAICAGRLATDQDMENARRLFSASGRVCEIEESAFDIVTALSGSGPAFWTQLAEYEQRQAEASGLSAETARTLILQTMLGTARVLLETDQSFSDFMNAVASKGGTTAAGLEVLRESSAADILADVLRAAAARSEALQQ